MSDGLGPLFRPEALARNRQVERAEPLGAAPLSAAIFTAFFAAMLAAAVAYARLVDYSSMVALSGVMASVGPDGAEAEFLVPETLARCLAPGQVVAARAVPDHAVVAGTIRSIVAAVASYRVRVSLDAPPPFGPGAPLSAVVTIDSRSLLAWMMAWRPGGLAHMSCTS